MARTVSKTLIRYPLKGYFLDPGNDPRYLRLTHYANAEPGFRAANPTAPHGAVVVSGLHMKICYVDEAGCTGRLPSANSDIQPVLVIAAIIIDYQRLHDVTEQFLQLKQRFFPSIFPSDRRYFLSGVLSEVKGADLRRQIAFGNRNQRRHAFGFIDGIFRIMQDNNILIHGRVWVKGVGGSFDGKAVYTYSIQSIYSTFQAYLNSVDDLGVVTIDSRWQSVNRQVSHSVFTQKFRMSGDAYDHIIDMPSFAHSENHVGIQIADLLASAVLFPVSTATYCAGHIANVHVQPRYDLIRERYKAILKQQQFRYAEANGRWRGGVTVSDAIAGRSGGALFA